MFKWVIMLLPIDLLAEERLRQSKVRVYAKSAINSCVLNQISRCDLRGYGSNDFILAKVCCL